MADKGNNIRVNIYGHEYMVKAVADPSYIAEVSAYVDERMRETELNLQGAQTPARVAILAAMSITDELFSERSKHTKSLEEIEKRSLNISSMVEEVLDSALKS